MSIQDNNSSFFFLQSDIKREINRDFLEQLENFAVNKKQQLYVINRPLVDNKYTCEYQDAIVLLSPRHKILFMDFGNNEQGFDNFIDDFIDDLGAISDKFRYKSIIGRPRDWKLKLTSKKQYKNNLSVQNIFSDIEIEDGKEQKDCELLISLLIGSINNIDLIKINVPDNLLDKVKQKIILFDGDQTRFLYQKRDNKKFTVQGLSGTGKTELLLHKLKELYLASADSKILFTCHNKVLANDLRNRIPDFFNFMKVEQQIEWEKRLWCIHAWGSGINEHSGAYSYISHCYKIPFLRFSPSTSFDSVCRFAIKEIEAIKSNTENFSYAFDFILIDESQDFPKSFFDLCETVTKHNVYIVGDIFQSIFEAIKDTKIDYLLNKCYRTDPKNLMFAHALGMGLFENPKLRWLKDSEWQSCGYFVEDNNNNKLLSRERLRRFEDLEHYASVEIITTSDITHVENEIIAIIQAIKKENPTVLAHDIGIILAINDYKELCLLADKLEQSVPRHCQWRVNKAYQSKHKEKDKVFISNQNNVKGLEFPFVICVAENLSRLPKYRNALYMALTRSFIKSYFLVSNKDSCIKLLEEGLRVINENGYIEVKPPFEVRNITIDSQDSISSLRDRIYEVFDELDIELELREKLLKATTEILDENSDDDDIRETIVFNHKKMKKQKKVNKNVNKI